MARDWWTEWDLSYLDDVYGPLYGGHSVQEAVYNTIQTWMPTYVAEINRVLGSKVLEVPIEYRHRPEYRTLPKRATAAVIVEVPSTVGQPRVAQSHVRVDWRVAITIYVFGTKDWQETQALTSAYAACIRALLLQNRGLGGFAETTMWESEEYMEGEHSSGRTTGIAHIRLSVTIGNAVNIYGGLPSPQYAARGTNTQPTTNPPDPVPIATSADVSVTKEQ